MRNVHGIFYTLVCMYMVFSVASFMTRRNIGLYICLHFSPSL